MSSNWAFHPQLMAQMASIRTSRRYVAPKCLMEGTAMDAAGLPRAAKINYRATSQRLRPSHSRKTLSVPTIKEEMGQALMTWTRSMLGYQRFRARRTSWLRSMTTTMKMITRIVFHRSRSVLLRVRKRVPMVTSMGEEVVIQVSSSPGCPTRAAP